MNNRKTTQTLSRYLLLPILLMAALLFPSLTSATPYATSLTNNGPGTSISFRVNESGFVSVIWTNLATATITNNFGNRNPGLITTNMSGGGGPVPGTFAVTITKTNAPGYVSGVAQQISTDSFTNGAALSTNVMRFPSLRGVAVNTNPASSYFGRIYVANSAAGATAPRASIGDGIFLINADFTEAVNQFTTARTAGITTFTNATETDGSVNSPWRLSVGEDNNLYIADFSTNSGTIYVTDPDVLTGTNIIAGLGTSGTPGALSPSVNHGRIGSSVIAKGSTNAGNLVLYALDTDATNTTDLFGNFITGWSIGSGPYAQDLVVTNLDNRTLLPNAGITEDLAMGPDGKFYTLQNRSDGNEAGIYVVDPTVDGGVFNPIPDGLWDKTYDSRADSIANHGQTVDLLRQARAVAISPDGKFMAVARDDANTWIIALTNGIPNLSDRRLVATGGTSLGRDLAFDAAGNLYVAASGNSALRVYSPGFTTVATTTSSGTFSMTNIVPNQYVRVTGTDTNAMEIDPVSDDGSVTFSRTGDLGVPLTINYLVTGTATRGADYLTNVFGIIGNAGATNSVTLPIGVGSTNVNVLVINDTLGEAVETVVFTVLSSANYVTVNNTAATVYIVDDGIDLPNVNVTARGLGSYELLPNRPAKFIVSLSAVWGSNVNANVSLAGSAVAGVDYTGPASFVVTIPAGSLSVTNTVTPIDNGAIAINKTIIYNIDSGVGYTNVGAISATNTLRNDDLPVTTTLFSENFDVDPSANWTVKVFNVENSANLFFDYGATMGIPSAPNSSGGTTRGMWMKAHQGTLSTSSGVTASPTTLVINTNNYRLRFDMWMNFCSDFDGTTEMLLAGFGSHTNLNTPFGSPKAAVYFACTGEGGQGASGDYRVITNTSSLANGGVVTVAAPGGSRDNLDPYYDEFGETPAVAGQTGLFSFQTEGAPRGCVGMAWHDVLITKTPTRVSWFIDGLPMISIVTSNINSVMASNFFIGYYDPNTGSIAGTANGRQALTFGLVDNVRVEVLPPSTNANLASLVVAPGGALNPAFSSNTVSYVSTNTFANNPVTVTAAVADLDATLQLSVNGGAFAPLTSGVASSAQGLVLNPSPNTLVVRVTAQDGVTAKDYTVNALLQPSPTIPTLTNSLSGATLSLNWPATHIGYQLQTQTNSTSTGLGSTWFTVPGSTTTNGAAFTINPANPTVFFRLLYPF